MGYTQRIVRPAWIFGCPGHIRGLRKEHESKNMRLLSSEFRERLRCSDRCLATHNLGSAQSAWHFGIEPVKVFFQFGLRALIDSNRP